MTFLDTITRAEKEAEKIREDARLRVSERVEGTRARQLKVLEDARSAYGEKEKMKKDEAIAAADTEGKTLIEEGKKELLALRSRAEKNMAQATQFILENI